MVTSVADWIAYAAARGVTVEDNAEAAQALLRAEDYIAANYVSRFVAPHDEGSAGVETATYIAAKLELDTPHLFTATYTPAQAKVLTKVDALEWTVTGGASDAASQVPVSTAIEALLARYLPLTGGAVLLRAVG